MYQNSIGPKGRYRGELCRDRTGPESNSTVARRATRRPGDTPPALRIALEPETYHKAPAGTAGALKSCVETKPGSKAARPFPAGEPRNV